MRVRPARWPAASERPAGRLLPWPARWPAASERPAGRLLPWPAGRPLRSLPLAACHLAARWVQLIEFTWTAVR